MSIKDDPKLLRQLAVAMREEDPSEYEGESLEETIKQFSQLSNSFLEASWKMFINEADA